MPWLWSPDVFQTQVLLLLVLSCLRMADNGKIWGRQEVSMFRLIFSTHQTAKNWGDQGDLGLRKISPNLYLKTAASVLQF